MPALSLRLGTIAESVPRGARVCDIGTDHGYLAIHLKKTGIAASVIATDLNIKPLLRAEKNIAMSGVCGIELRLCDGLSGIAPGEVDTVVIAGMGGEVISSILERGEKTVKSGDVTVILQPTTSPEILRSFLCNNGFKIDREVPVSENGKVYSVISCRFTGECETHGAGFYYIGKVKPDSESGMLYIKKQQKRCFDCMTALEKKGDCGEIYLQYKNAYESISNRLKECSTEN